MTFAADQSIGEQLALGERLLWTGQPAKGFRVRRSDLVLIPFSLLWAGFAVMWEIQAIRGGNGFFPFWGLAFVLVGLYFVAGRFFVDAWQREATAYGLTDRRAIIVKRTLLSGREVKSMPLRTLDSITLEQHRDGSATVVIGADGGRYPGWLARSSWPGLSSGAAPAFEMIANAREVYEQMQELVAAHGRTW
jgi:hypothetical protein